MSINRRRFLAAASGLLSPLAVFAQDPKRIARIGWLGIRNESGTADRSIPLEGLRAGLKDRGWVEGRNLVIEERNGTFDNAHELAQQLVQSNVALIVVEAGMIFRIVKVSDTIPMLFHVNGDPVEAKNERQRQPHHGVQAEDGGEAEKYAQCVGEGGPVRSVVGVQQLLEPRPDAFETNHLRYWEWASEMDESGGQGFDPAAVSLDAYGWFDGQLADFGDFDAAGLLDDVPQSRSLRL